MLKYDIIVIIVIGYFNPNTEKERYLKNAVDRQTIHEVKKIMENVQLSRKMKTSIVNTKLSTKVE